MATGFELDTGGKIDAGLPLGEAVNRVAGVLQHAGFTNARLDARLLVGTATGMSREDMVRDPTLPLDAGAATALNGLLRRRLTGEPIARMTGIKEFWGRPFAIGPQTLAPRPDSETLVDVALRLFHSGTLPPTSVIADLGTGSGCLLISILADFPLIRGIGTDLSLPALHIARQNAHMHDVAGRILFVNADFGSVLPEGLDLIVANPPYIASDEIATLARDVRDFDPRLALDGGDNGLACYKVLVPQAARSLAPEGRILLEIGQGQENDVAEILRICGFDVNPAIGFVRDYAGIVRVIQGSRRAS